MTIFGTGNDRLGIPNLDAVSDTALVALGTTVKGFNDVSQTNGEFMYVQAAAALTDGQIVQLDLHNKVDLVGTAHANSGKSVAFVVGAVAINQFCFVQISGKAKAKSGAVVADAKVMLTATPGTVDDAAVAGCQLVGAEFATADGTPAAGFAYVSIDRPSIQSQIT